MRAGRRSLLGSALLALALLPGRSAAHQAGLSYGTFAVEGDRVELAFRISAAELAAAWPELASPASLRGGPPPALVSEVLDGISLRQGAEACAPGAAHGRLEAPDSVELERGYRCPRTGEPIQVRLGVVARFPPGHVHLAKVVREGRVEEHVVDARSDGFAVVARGSWWTQAARFVLLGVEHIFTGWDHIAFLLGLLLAGGALRDVIRVVTSFTVAHALTLALATLGLVSPPAALVEPLIAVSVLYVGLENLRDLRRKSGRGAGRWRIAFGFGLVHGFGFAGALRELHLPGSGLATALFSFNLGVELAQAAIVAAAFPLLTLLRRRDRFAAAVPFGSTTVGVAGLVWLLERVPW